MDIYEHCFGALGVLPGTLEVYACCMWCGYPDPREVRVLGECPEPHEAFKQLSRLFQCQDDRTVESAFYHGHLRSALLWLEAQP